jgi:hypothetical protein
MATQVLSVNTPHVAHSFIHSFCMTDFRQACLHTHNHQDTSPWPAHTHHLCHEHMLISMCSNQHACAHAHTYRQMRCNFSHQPQRTTWPNAHRPLSERLQAQTCLRETKLPKCTTMASTCPTFVENTCMLFSTCVLLCMCTALENRCIATSAANLSFLPAQRCRWQAQACG